MLHQPPADQPATDPRPDHRSGGSDEAHGTLLTRRRVIIGGLALGAVPVLAACDPAPAYPYRPRPANPCNFGYDWPRPQSERHVREIMWPVLADPVLGKATWTDTYMAPRGTGSCRFHEGADLMGKRMLKLLACVDGTIVELRHRADGNMLIIRDAAGYHYCYLHINDDDPGTTNNANQFQHAFAPGMAVGRTVRRGEHVAYLGDSGNAGGNPHLHFEIRVPNASMWKAAAVDPGPSLRRALPAQLFGTGVAPETFTPFTDATPFVARQATDFLGGAPSGSWTTTSVDRLRAGTVTPDAFIEELLGTTQVVHQVNPIIRLYQAYFGGIPAAAGVAHWVRQVRSGMSLDQASAELAASAKFRDLYGPLDDYDFCAQFFRNLYGYEPTAASVNLRLTRMRNGMTRGQVVRYECETPGYRSPTAQRTRVLSVYHAMVGRSPNQTWLDNWSELDRTSPTGLRELIATHRTSAEYANRVAV